LIDQTAENDVRAGHRRVIVAGVVGNVLEWYDFALFGVLAPIIAPHFFPSADPLASLINSYAVFAIGFLARPLGGVIFGQIGDRFGRRQALVLSVVMMAVPTCLMGLLPTYQSVGILAPILLTLLRIVQGISTGGEFSGSIIFLVEQAPDHRRGLFGSIANFGSMIGGLMGTAVGWLISVILTPEAMQDWGWRLPFFTGIVVGLFGLWARSGVPDTPAFKELQACEGLHPQPLRAALREEWKPMLVAASLNSTASVGYYVVFVWFISNMSEIIGLPYQTALAIGTFGLVVGLVATLAMGHVSDVVGHRRMLALGAIVTALFAVPLLLLAAIGTLPAVAFGQAGLAVLAAIFLGTLPAVFVSLHGPALRCTALSLSYNTALAIFGGTAPLIATLLVKITGWPGAPGLYLVLTAFVCLALLPFVPRFPAK
jgi:MHS family proline/betaine transporter-like MFS transporter